MSRGVYVQVVSVQEGICPGVSVRGVHVRGGLCLRTYFYTHAGRVTGRHKYFSMFPLVGL